MSIKNSNLSALILKAHHKIDFIIQPSPIQQKVIPQIINQKSVIWSA